MALSQQHEEHVPPQSGARDWLRSRLRLASYVALAALAVLIIRDHATHLLSAVPYLLLLACPLMHMFMHHGHQHHGHDQARRNNRRAF